MAEFSYFLAPGTISKATLTGTSSYNIENWPYQSDQNQSRRWREPLRANTLRPAYARYVPTMDGLARGDGFVSFTWNIGTLTVGMFSYLDTTFFSSGTLEAARVTVQTYNRTGYDAYQAILRRPVANADYTPRDGEYTDVLLHFSYGVVL